MGVADTLDRAHHTEVEMLGTLLATPARLAFGAGVVAVSVAGVAGLVAGLAGLALGGLAFARTRRSTV